VDKLAGGRDLGMGGFGIVHQMELQTVSIMVVCA